MRLVKQLLFWAGCGSLGMVLAMAQTPIAIGPSTAANSGLGVVKFFDWYDAIPTGGCINGAAGACVGHAPQGDTYYWTAWLPNASGLPVTGGLPVVGTSNDWSFGSCGGNIGVLQLDTFSWAAPTASHITRVNCMTSYGTAPGTSDVPTGWNGHLTSADSVGNAGTWKNRTPFSKGGIIYLPVERQISAGGPSVHDATFIMSPDSGKHWCNPYTYANHAGGPGCDSSNWQADGDAPKCDSPSSSTPCANAAYLDSTHSSIMWNALPYGTENWYWINYGNQDGTAAPGGIRDGCDPSTYACFFLLDGSLARVPNASIMDVSAWRYYTCSTITQSYRCPGADSANWTATLANRTPVLYSRWYGSTFFDRLPLMSGVMYLKEFGSYVMAGATFYGTGKSVSWLTAPAIQGPWTQVFQSPISSNALVPDFINPSPALGYTVVGTSPPHVQATFNSNSYKGGMGSPQFHMWDFVLGGQASSGEAFASTNRARYISGAGYQFSDGHIAGSFPRKGLVWSFDFLDQGAHAGYTDWPYFLDRGNYSAVVKVCDGGYTPTFCGSVNASHGTSINDYGVWTGNSEYGGHFRVMPSEMSPYNAVINAPSAFTGNGSYSVVGVYRYEGITAYRPGGIWSTGTSGVNMVEFNQSSGNLLLDWGDSSAAHYRYISTFTFPDYSHWYFVAVTVQAQTAGCGSSCTPTANIWVGGAVTPGVLKDALAGVSLAPFGSPTTITPNVGAGPLVLGINHNGDGTVMTNATTMVYGRALTFPEVQLMYQSMKTKMAARGVTLQ